MSTKRLKWGTFLKCQDGTYATVRDSYYHGPNLIYLVKAKSGGTPFEVLDGTFKVMPGPELSLEGRPDDVIAAHLVDYTMDIPVLEKRWKRATARMGKEKKVKEEKIWRVNNAPREVVVAALHKAMLKEKRNGKA